MFGKFKISSCAWQQNLKYIALRTKTVTRRLQLAKIGMKAISTALISQILSTMLDEVNWIMQPEDNIPTQEIIKRIHKRTGEVLFFIAMS